MTILDKSIKKMLQQRRHSGNVRIRAMFYSSSSLYVDFNNLTP